MNSEVKTIKEKVFASHQSGDPKISPFLNKCFDMLNDRELRNIVSWNPEGDALVIKDTGSFTQEVLPKFFKHCNLASFTRQLNMYQFSKLKQKEYHTAYQHPHFLRDNRESMANIVRKSHISTPIIQDVQPKTPITTQKPKKLENNTDEYNDSLSRAILDNQVLKRDGLYYEKMVNMVQNQLQDVLNVNQNLTQCIIEQENTARSLKESSSANSGETYQGNNQPCYNPKNNLQPAFSNSESNYFGNPSETKNFQDQSLNISKFPSQHQDYNPRENLEKTQVQPQNMESLLDLPDFTTPSVDIEQPDQPSNNNYFAHPHKNLRQANPEQNYNNQNSSMMRFEDEASWKNALQLMSNYVFDDNA